MSRFWRKALIIAAILVFLPVAAGLAATAAVYSLGTIHLEVDVDGAHFAVPLPAGIIPVALHFVPRQICRDLEDEVAPQWDALRAAADALSEIPDAVLVEVDDRGDQVTVAKQGRALVVDVRSDDERVAVSIPVGIVSSAVRHLERTCS